MDVICSRCGELEDEVETLSASVEDVEDALERVEENVQRNERAIAELGQRMDFSEAVQSGLMIELAADREEQARMRAFVAGHLHQASLYRCGNCRRYGDNRTTCVAARR